MDYYKIQPKVPEIDLTPWRKVPEFPRYEMNYRGEIRDRESGKTMKVHVNRTGGQYVTFRKGRRGYNRSPIKIRKDLYGY